ncbi:MAG: glycosyltransferase family 2 protein [Acidimicrobiia bacterium]|nr:glycosyltransferase family 2 protein [Acidimicrobiia bacterium]
MPALSVVATLFRSSAHIREFHRRMSAAASRVTRDYEIVFVDDGSPDDSLEIATHLVASDPHVKVVELSRNFGHHRAMMTGLSHARGALVFLIDVDLEERPEWLSEFHERLRADGSDVVYGYQSTRKGRVLERAGGALHWWLIRWLASYPVPSNLTTARLMTRQYVRALLRHREQRTALGGLFALTGFRQQGVAVSKGSRAETSYTVLKRAAMALEGVTAFSEKPLVLVFFGGAVIFALSLLVAAYLVGRRLTGTMLPGWVSVIVSVWMLGGLAIASIGVVGLYVARIFVETKRRPYSIVRRIHAHPDAATDEQT